MNRVLVAGIAGLAMLLAASVDVQAGFGRKCGGDTSCGGGLFSKLGSRADRGCGGGGLFAKHRAKKADCCAPVDTCCEAAPACCEPAPTCCEPAPSCCTPAPTCCAPAPTCCTPAPSCCSAPVSGCSSCGGSVMTSGCPNCSTTVDAGVIMESSAPSVAPPAPAPIADPAADAPSASDAPEA